MPLDFSMDLAKRFLAQVAADRDVVLVGLTGAHAYGFPSPDSDYDLKGVMLLSPSEMLGLDAPGETLERMEVFGGVEHDLTLHDARKSLQLLVRGNGNALEHALAPVQLMESERADAYRRLARGSVSKRFAHHYRGFFHRKRAEHAREPRAKSLLYAYRVALTGAWLLESGELEQDVRVNAERFAIAEVATLVALKRERDETCALSPAEDAELSTSLPRAIGLLEERCARSRLPDEAPNRDAMSRWLVQTRLSQGGSSGHVPAT